MKDPHLERLVGRRIVGAILKKGPSGPATQLFLMLDDGTYTEVFSDYLGISTGWPGGVERARAYMESTHKITHEAHLPKSARGGPAEFSPDVTDGESLTGATVKGVEKGDPAALGPLKDAPLSSEQRAWLASPEGQIHQILDAFWAAYEEHESKMEAASRAFGGMWAIDKALKSDPEKMLELFVSQNPRLNPRDLPKDYLVTAMAVFGIMAIDE